MEQQEPTELTPEQSRRLEIEEVKKTLSSGANWFYWIAGLSLVNSLVHHFGGGWSFIVGLGITQLVDAVALGILEGVGVEARTAVWAAALALDVAIAGLFVLFGWLANQRQRWAFLVGMTLYALDGLLFLLVQDWLSLGFHAFALFGLYSGLSALGRLQNLEAPEPASAFETPQL